MKITFETCDPQQINAVAFYAALVELTARLSDPERLSLVLSGHYEQSVRTRLGQGETVGAFSAERITGLNVAKVLPRGDGSCEVVVNAGLLSLEANWGPALRIFAHESCHLLTHERREGARYLRRRAPSGDAYYLDLAAVLIDEYRAERALDDFGWVESTGWFASLHDGFRNFSNEVKEALPVRSQQELERLRDLVSGRFAEIVTPFAYLAAEWLAQARRPDDHDYVNSPTWRRFVGDHWPALLAALSTVPSADHPMDETAFSNAMDLVADRLRAWLAEVGFQFDDTPEGLFFRILRHDFSSP